MAPLPQLACAVRPPPRARRFVPRLLTASLPLFLVLLAHISAADGAKETPNADSLAKVQKLIKKTDGGRSSIPGATDSIEFPPLAVSDIGTYFIECVPEPIEKEEEKLCTDLVKKVTAAIGSKAVDTLTALMKETSKVDPATSAENEQISEQFYHEVYPEKAKKVDHEKFIDRQEEEKQLKLSPAFVELATKLQVNVRARSLGTAHLPLIKNRHWPTVPNEGTTVAFCLDQVEPLFGHSPRREMLSHEKTFFYKALRAIRKVAKKLVFKQVGCGDKGHKIKVQVSQANLCYTDPGYVGNIATAGTLEARDLSRATDQELECDLTSYNEYSAAHEFIHALGFGHTHQRAGRDRYLDVQLSNHRARDMQYAIVGYNQGSFDFDSVMLYPASPQGAAAPKHAAKSPLPGGSVGNKANMGQRSKISTEDARILNLVYK